MTPAPNICGAQVELFRANFPDALALMPNLAENYFANPTGSMVTVRCFPWHQEGNILLLGDAAHAIVPFFGQGINCGFEDHKTASQGAHFNRVIAITLASGNSGAISCAHSA